MNQKIRLDKELVRRKIVTSRQNAVELINSEKILVNGFKAQKASTLVNIDDSIKTKDVEKTWASRGAYKLISAFEKFIPGGLDIKSKNAVDAGASTGGFTDVLIQSGVNKVYAVDVGYGQLRWGLQNNPKVIVKDRTNVRFLTKNDFQDEINLIVGDLSFISLKKVLETFFNISSINADIIPLIKPQFEVGKSNLGKNGVVTNLALHREVIQKVISFSEKIGFSCKDVQKSGLPGPAGNVEYFIWLKKGDNTISNDIISKRIDEEIFS